MNNSVTTITASLSIRTDKTYIRYALKPGRWTIFIYIQNTKTRTLPLLYFVVIYCTGCLKKNATEIKQAVMHHKRG